MTSDLIATELVATEFLFSFSFLALIWAFFSTVFNKQSSVGSFFASTKKRKVVLTRFVIIAMFFAPFIALTTEFGPAAPMLKTLLLVAIAALVAACLFVFFEVTSVMFKRRKAPRTAGNYQFGLIDSAPHPSASHVLSEDIDPEDVAFADIPPTQRRLADTDIGAENEFLDSDILGDPMIDENIEEESIGFDTVSETEALESEAFDGDQTADLEAETKELQQDFDDADETADLDAETAEFSQNEALAEAEDYDLDTTQDVTSEINEISSEIPQYEMEEPVEAAQPMTQLAAAKASENTIVDLSLDETADLSDEPPLEPFDFDSASPIEDQPQADDTPANTTITPAPAAGVNGSANAKLNGTAESLKVDLPQPLAARANTSSSITTDLIEPNDLVTPTATSNQSVTKPATISAKSNTPEKPLESNVDPVAREADTPKSHTKRTNGAHPQQHGTLNGDAKVNGVTLKPNGSAINNTNKAAAPNNDQSITVSDVTLEIARLRSENESLTKSLDSTKRELESVRSEYKKTSMLARDAMNALEKAKRRQHTAEARARQEQTERALLEKRYNKMSHLIDSAKSMVAQKLDEAFHEDSKRSVHSHEDMDRDNESSQSLL